MHNSYVAVLDSGIGGISVLKNLVKEFPSEKFIYLGDRLNAPYGNKNIQELFFVTMKNVDFLKKFPLKAIILACNTLSVNLRDDIEFYANIPVFGIFPPVESLLAQGKKVLLLSTVRTAEQYKDIKNLDAVGLKYLARDIENNMFNLSAVDFEKNLKFSVGNFHIDKGYYDAIILGCTHYEFIKNKIFNHFCPQSMVSGIDLLSKKLRSHLNYKKTSVKHKDFNILFLGDSATIYKKFYLEGG